MRVTLPQPPFDRDGLSAVFGFPVPPPFVEVLNALCQDCTDGEAACERVDDALHWLLAGADQRYQQTPPELFPIAATGVDGGHFGYVIHAPELLASDYPIARFEPMDSWTATSPSLKPVKARRRRAPTPSSAQKTDRTVLDRAQEALRGGGGQAAKDLIAEVRAATRRKSCRRGLARAQEAARG